MERHQLRLDVGPEFLLGFRECHPRSDVGRIAVRQRMVGFPRDRCAKLGIEREQFEQNRRPGARGADDEDRPFDGPWTSFSSGELSEQTWLMVGCIVEIRSLLAARED